MKSDQSIKSKTIYDLQAEICAALASPVRLQILDLIGDGEKTSSELSEVLQLPKPNLSQHLSVLREAGILRARRDGHFQYLSLALPKVKEACSIVKSVLAEKVNQEERRHAELKKELKKETRAKV